MSNIGRDLLNPEWWFSVVFAALLVGVVAPLLSKWLSKFFSFISRRYAQHAEIANNRRQRFIEFRCEHPEILTMDLIQSSVMVVFAFGIIAMSFVLPAWNLLIHIHPEVDPTVILIGSKPIDQIKQDYFAFGLSIVGLYLWYKSNARWALCLSTKTIYVKRLRDRKLIDERLATKS